MAVFFTSDPHIGHRLVAKYRRQRLHPDVDWGEQPDVDAVVAWHNELLAHNWDTTVGKADQVWVLGDVSLGNPTPALDWVKERPGDKHLVLGNHDKAHPTHRDSHRWFPQYMDAFSSVQLAARRKIAVVPNAKAEEVLLSHLPYHGDRDAEDRCTQWRLRNEGSWLLHGHLHSDEPMSPDRPKMIDVGLDAWNFTPVSLDQIVELMR